MTETYFLIPSPNIMISEFISNQTWMLKKSEKIVIMEGGE